MLDAADRRGSVAVLREELEPAAMIDRDQVTSAGGDEPAARVRRQSVGDHHVAGRQRVDVDVASSYDVVATSAVAHDRRRRTAAKHVTERRRATVPDRQRLLRTSSHVRITIDVRRGDVLEMSNADTGA